MSRLWTIMRKEIYHIWRDPRTLGMILALPALLLALLGYGVSGETRDTRLAVVDLARSDTSRWYVDRFTASSDFFQAYDALSEAALIDLIDRDKVDVGILIPEDFDRRLAGQESAVVQIYIDGSMNPTDAMTVQLKLGAISQMAAQDILVRRVERSGQAGGLNLPVQGILKTLYNPDGDRQLYMVPGLMAILLQIQTLILSALAIVREREQGTMEQLIVTPVRSWELMLGKIIPYLVVSVFNLFALVWLSQILFGVRVAGSLGVLVGLSTVFIVGSLAMGVLISTISQSQMQAIYISVFLVLIPAIIISGLMFSRESMPAATYWYSELLPMTHYLEITSGIIVRGWGPRRSSGRRRCRSWFSARSIWPPAWRCSASACSAVKENSMKRNAIKTLGALGLALLLVSGCAAAADDELAGTGFLSAAEVAIAPELSGRVASVEVREGEAVTAGQVPSGWTPRYPRPSATRPRRPSTWPRPPSPPRGPRRPAPRPSTTRPSSAPAPRTPRRAPPPGRAPRPRSTARPGTTRRPSSSPRPSGRSMRPRAPSTMPGPTWRPSSAAPPARISSLPRFAWPPRRAPTPPCRPPTRRPSLPAATPS